MQTSIKLLYSTVTFMLLTPHTLVGTAIAYNISNPLISVPLALGMHFMGDMVPHWDFYSNTERKDRLNGWRPLAVMADLALGIFVGTAFTLYALWVKGDSTLALNTFLCGIASVLPDALTGPSLYMKKPLKVTQWVHSIQSKLQFQAPLPWGLITQGIVTTVALLLISGSIRL